MVCTVVVGENLIDDIEWKLFLVLAVCWCDGWVTWVEIKV